MQEQELLDLKKKIDEAKTEVAELNGKKKQLMKTLKEEWSCDSLDRAKTALVKLEESIDTFNKRIKTGTAELEQKYVVKTEQE